MKSILTLLLAVAYTFVFSQKVGINNNTPQEALDVKGKIRISDDTTNQSTAGTIRFNQETQDFEGFDGSGWVPFTPDHTDFYWPQPGDRGGVGGFYPFSPSDGVQGDNFGFSVDIHGNIAVIGSPDYNTGRGRVHILRRYPNNIWQLEAVLESPNPQVDSHFGYSVAISGNKIVVGQPDYTIAGFPSFGAAYVFTYTTGTWVYLHYLSSNDTCHKKFGHDVDIEANRIIVSAPYALSTCWPLRGRIYGFDSAGSGLFNFTTFSIDPPHYIAYADNGFGHSIAISSPWIAISAPFSTASPNVDSVYMFKNDTPTSFKHKHSLGGAYYDDEFGYSLGLNGSIMTIGAPKADLGIPNSNRGLGHLCYVNPNDTWSITTNIAGRDTLSNFGISSAVSSDYMIVAAKHSYFQPDPYIQVCNNQGGYLRSYVSIVDPDATLTDQEVNEVSMWRNYFIVGIPTGTSVNGQQGGRVYLGKIR